MTYPTTSSITIDPRAIRRIVVASSIGTIIEWYDFALYGAASALVFTHVIFPNQTQFVATLSSFAVFAVAFFLRPVGGLIAAHIGDRFGRKPVLIATVTLMGVSTMLIGLLPSYNTIGVWAPILLIAIRCLQGLGAGAEFSGAVTAVSEYVPQNRRAYYTSWSQASVGLAIALATGVFALLALAPQDVLLGWLWRVPFLASVVIFGVAIFIRRRIEETPLFQKTQEAIESGVVAPQRIPLSMAFREAPRELIVGVLCGSGLNVAGYLLNTFALSYVVNTLKMPAGVGTLAVVIGVGCSFFTVPIFGALADRIGRKPVFIGGAIFLALYAIPFFLLLDTRNPVLIIIAVFIGYAVGQASLLGSQSAFLAELFPTRYRFTGIAFAREINVMLLGGTTPYIATALVAAAGGSPALVIAFAGAALLITIVSVALTPARRETPGAAVGGTPVADSAAGTAVS